MNDVKKIDVNGKFEFIYPKNTSNDWQFGSLIINTSSENLFTKKSQRCMEQRSLFFNGKNLVYDNFQQRNHNRLHLHACKWSDIKNDNTAFNES